MNRNFVQDQTTDDEFAEKRGYKKVENIFDVPFGTRIRYFTKKDGKKYFQKGLFQRKYSSCSAFIILKEQDHEFVLHSDINFYIKPIKKTFDEAINSINEGYDILTFPTKFNTLFLECTNVEQIDILLKNGYIIGFNDLQTVDHIDKLLHANDSRISFSEQWVQIIIKIVPYLDSVNKTYGRIGHMINVQDMTLIEFACACDSSELLELLISLRADFDIDKMLRSLNIHNGKTRVATLLITKYGININRIVDSKSLLCRYLCNENCDVNMIVPLASDVTIGMNDNITKITKYINNIPEIYDLLKTIQSWDVPGFGEAISISKLFQMKELYFDNHNIKEIPTSINLMQRLELISLASNNIKKIPKSIGKLINLKCLILNDNNIKKIPKSIGKLINLEILLLENNPIIKLPRSIKHLTNLKTFKISSTNLENIDQTIKRCINMSHIMRIDNMLLSEFTKQIVYDDPYTLPMLTDAYGNIKLNTPGELAIALCEVSSQPFPPICRMFIKPSTVKCLINHTEVEKYFGEGIYIEIPIYKADICRIQGHMLMIHNKGLFVKFPELYVIESSN